MRRVLLATGIGFALAALSAQAADSQVTFIDLQPKANQKLKENLHSDDNPGNNLAALPAGEQTLAGVKFKIGDGLIQLGSQILTGKPTKVEGIVVDRPVANLHILHATGYSTEDDTEIGSYTIHYADKTKETIPIVYGKDVRDWWFGDAAPDVTRGKVAWMGDNEAAKGLGSRVRLYLTTWKNPHPDKKVVSIDYASKNDAQAAPFCVAITAEGK
jgi:hypothetical protein